MKTYSFQNFTVDFSRGRFGPRERAGLLTFLELARDVGELAVIPELRFVHEEAVTA